MQNNKKDSKTDKKTIFDVAKSAGVAVSTVSRVINNKGDVSEDTRRKVLQSMQLLDYTPNIAARILGGAVEQEVKVGSLNVRLITKANLQEDPYFIHIMRGAERKLNSEGFNCVFSQISDNIYDNNVSDNRMQELRFFKEGNDDGVIVVGIDSAYLSEIFRERGLPAVFVDCSDFGSDFNYIKADNYDGAKKAVDYLIELGHKRVAIISGGAKLWFFNELESGYMSAHKSKNLAYRPELIVNGENNPNSGYLMTMQLLKLSDPPTAIFTNDITAIGVVKAVRDYGLRIPQDISVIGFDDIDAASFIEPSLTTVKVMKTEMGELAAKKVVQMIREPENSIPSKVLLPVNLIIRDSTAPPCSSKK